MKRIVLPTKRTVQRWVQSTFLVICCCLVAGNYGMVSAQSVSPHDKDSILDETTFYDIVPLGTCGGEADTTTLSGRDNTQKAFNYFVAKGLTPEQTAGILGNFWEESKMNPAIQQGGGTQPPYPVNGRGFGIAQWTFTSRQKPLVDLANSRNEPVTSLAVQLDYVWKELNGSHKAALDGLKGTSTVADAAFIFHKIYEVSADTREQIQERVASGEDILKRYGAGAATGSYGTEACSSSGQVGGCNIYGPDGKLKVGQMQGNEAILACARLFDPYGYDFGGGHYSPKEWMQWWEKQGEFKNKTFRQILDCSSIEMMAIYLAFGESLVFSTSTMGNMPNSFRRIPVSEAQPGDLMWRVGHTEIAINKGGTKTFGAHTANTAQARQISDSKGGRWTAAYVYIGPGSTRK